MGLTSRLVALTVLAVVAVACNGAGNEGHRAPATVPPGPVGVSITDPWCAPTGTVDNGPDGDAVACYMTITAAMAGDTLLGVEVPEGLAERAELEVTTGPGSVATTPEGEPVGDDPPVDTTIRNDQRDRIDELVIPPEEAVQLQPGGHQIVVLGLRPPVEVGLEIEMTLRFEAAGEFAVVTEVREP
jgi:copper(I)-binding protein